MTKAPKDQVSRRQTLKPNIGKSGTPSSALDAKTLEQSVETARLAMEIFRRLHPEWAAFHWEESAHDHQKEPKGDWTTWLLLGGRGAGKTRAGAEWIRAITNPANDNQRRAIALVAESYADAREVMIEGPSGICAVAASRERPVYESSRRRLVWPDGAVAYAFSAEDPDGIRGYQFDAAWSDELCKWRYAEETWSNLQLALRLGARPRQIATTTPRSGHGT